MAKKIPTPAFLLGVIEAAGWMVADIGRRVVASKRIIEDDHSITMKYESAYTLEALAKNVRRREQETR